MKEEWSAEAMGNAMANFVLRHAQNPNIGRDGVVRSEAFYRDGDNETSLAVWPHAATWSDRKIRGGGANRFCLIVAQCTLPELMRDYGDVSLNIQRDERPQLDAQAVSDVWGACCSVLDAPDVCSWLKSRGFDDRALDLMHMADVARVLPGDGLPDWCASWGESHPLVVRLFDAWGEPRSLHGRAITDTTHKTTLPTGYKASGMVMANSMGKMLLGRQMHATQWTREARGPHGEQCVITEGLVDFLAWTTRASDADELAPPIFGVLSGSWVPDMGSRLPQGITVVIDTDADDVGDLYARKIAATLDDSITAARLRRTT